MNVTKILSKHSIFSCISKNFHNIKKYRFEENISFAGVVQCHKKIQLYYLLIILWMNRH